MTPIDARKGEKELSISIFNGQHKPLFVYFTLDLTIGRKARKNKFNV